MTNGQPISCVLFSGLWIIAKSFVVTGWQHLFRWRFWDLRLLLVCPMRLCWFVIEPVSSQLSLHPYERAATA